MPMACRRCRIASISPASFWFLACDVALRLSTCSRRSGVACTELWAVVLRGVKTDWLLDAPVTSADSGGVYPPEARAFWICFLSWCDTDMLRRRELRGSTSTVLSSMASSMPPPLSGEGAAATPCSLGVGCCSSSSSLDASGSQAPTTPTPSDSTPLLASTPRLASTPSLLATTKSSSSSARPSEAPPTTGPGCPHSSIRASLPSRTTAAGTAGEALPSSSSMSSITMSPEAGFLPAGGAAATPPAAPAGGEAAEGGLLGSLVPLPLPSAEGAAWPRPAALRLSSRREERKPFWTSWW
mmetsp:Transcript_292/g.764  ORF Transcript_292/g.764 Transcript_292/m.764 type:complete len:298 (-) Transcript_292:2568-3461(-)